jgi:hypothetical protein
MNATAVVRLGLWTFLASCGGQASTTFAHLGLGPTSVGDAGLFDSSTQQPAMGPPFDRSTDDDSDDASIPPIEAMAAIFAVDATSYAPPPPGVGPEAAASTPEADAISSVAVDAPPSSVQPDNSGLCLCTRRDLDPAGMCPRGVDQSATAMIGRDGGTVTLVGQQGTIALVFPPTALAFLTTITVTETSIPPPQGFVDYSPIYRVDPIDITFSAPVGVTVPFSNGRGSDTFDGNLALFWSTSVAEPFELERLTGSSPNAGVIEAAILNGGYGIAGYGSSGNVPYCN